MKISKEFKIGVFSVVCITLLYLGFNYLKGKDFFSSSNKYYAIYSNIDGLTVSNSIYVNGLTIGRVSDVVFLQDRDNQILVEIDIHENIRLDESTVAVLISEGFLGGKAIKLEIPDEINNPIEIGDTLHSSLEVSIVESISERALPIADDLGKTISMLNSILENFQGTELELKAAVIEFKMLAVRNQEKFSSMMSSLSSMSMNLDSASEELKPLLANANTLMDSLNALRLNEIMRTAHSTLQNLDTLLANLNEGEGTVGKLLHDDSLYFYLTRTAEDLDKLLVDFKENPSRYVQVSVFGKKDKTKKK